MDTTPATKRQPLTEDQRSTLRTSRIAGFWYLMLTVFSIFGMLWGDTRFFAAGDPAASLQRIVAEGLVYRLGIAANLIGQICFLWAGLWFYRLFEPVDKPLARTLLVVVATSVPVAFVNLLFQFVPLVLTGSPAYLAAFGVDQLQALSMLFLELQRLGILVVGAFWGLWLLPLGVLVFRSRSFPRVFGVLLVVNGLAYLLDSLLAVVLPDLRRAWSPVLVWLLTIGEIPFLAWLLVRGARPGGKTTFYKEPAKTD